MVWKLKKKFQPLKIAQELSRSDFLVLHEINVMHLRSVKGTGGGPEKTILLSGEKIDKEKFNMIIVYLKGIGDKTFGVTEKAKGFNVNYFEIAEKRRFDLNTIRKLRKLIREYKIDIVHTHDYKSDFYAWVLSKMYNIKLMATVHGWIGNDIKERFYNWLDKRILKYYDRIITVCDEIRHYLLKRGMASHKLITIHNAIDTDDFSNEGCLQDLRAELNLDKSTSVIGVIGRLSREKRIEALFSIAKKIISEVEDVKFLIVGDGPYKDDLVEFAKGLGIEDKTIFLGYRDDIKRVYKTIDLLVSLSRTEGLSNVILEAQSCEVAVVATKVGGTEEIIKDKVNGLLFSPQDLDGIADGIITLLSNRKMASNFAKVGRKLICEKFPFDERMRKIEKVYSEIMEIKE